MATYFWFGGSGDYTDRFHWQDFADPTGTPPAGPPESNDSASINPTNANPVVSATQDILLQGGSLFIGSTATLDMKGHLLTYESGTGDNIAGTVVASGGIDIAVNVGSQGGVRVTGNVSTKGAPVTVGDAGSGAIGVVGGKFDASNSNVFLGKQTTSIGAVTVSSGGKFIAGNLTAGVNGEGTIDVSDNGSSLTIDTLVVGGLTSRLGALNSGYAVVNNSVVMGGGFLLVSGGSMEIGGNSGFQSNQLTIDSAARLSGDGQVFVFDVVNGAGTILNNGFIFANDGLLNLQGNCSGSGLYEVDSTTVSSTLEINGNFSATATAKFFNGGTLKLDQPDPSHFTGTIAGLAPGDTIELATALPGQITSVNFDQSLTHLIINFSDNETWTYKISLGNFNNTSLQVKTLPDGFEGVTLTQAHTQVSPSTIQNDFLAINRFALPLDQATTEANAINAGTTTETAYVNSLLAQVADTTIPATAVEGSMYNAVGSSAEITKLVTQFLPAQVTVALANGLNAQVYTSEALGLAFAFGDENGGTAFNTKFGPANTSMPATAAGDAAFAAAAANAIFGSAANANTPGAILGFVSNWVAFYTAHGIPGIASATGTQIDLAARGAAWGDAVGVALANNLGPLPGQATNFLEDAAQGTAVYSASLSSQPTPAPFEGAASAASAAQVQLIGVAAPVDHVHM